jgi:hypothetical protein
MNNARIMAQKPPFLSHRALCRHQVNTPEQLEPCPAVQP